MFELLPSVLGKYLTLDVMHPLCAVGSVVGAMTGALMGLATESGLIRGAGIGAISGAVFSIQAVESSLDLWSSTESGILSVLYVVSWTVKHLFLHH